MTMEGEEISRVLESLDGITQPSNPNPDSASGKRKQSFWASKIWAKGTGYGTGSTFSWGSAKKVEQTLQRKQEKEKEVIELLDSLAILMKPQEGLEDTMKKSSLISVLSGYLRNESVLDIVDHIPVYRAILKLLRSIAAVPQLRSLLVSGEDERDSTISKLLVKMKDTVANYSKLLKASSARGLDLELIQLLQDVETTACQVEGAVTGFRFRAGNDQSSEEVKAGSSGSLSPITSPLPSPMDLGLEDRYVYEMRKLQFAFIEIIGEGQLFTVPYHYEVQVKENWTTGPTIFYHSRTKRLAQESITLSKSLPLSYGSSIFLRCDNDRLDVIKALITGPEGTPYSNGCFEFDIHFPLDYPQSPPMVNFQTTGGNKVRFNPNLYADGKVCLSILNTWVGSPEEKWNPKTSSLLPVLVAIQSLILVEQPFWNEPGTQFFGATRWAKRKSREYTDNIRHYTLCYAIWEQMRNPTSCFKEVIQNHFWMKRDEILAQLEEWRETSYEKDATNRDIFQQNVAAVKGSLLKMNPPNGLKDFKHPTKQYPKLDQQKKTSSLSENVNSNKVPGKASAAQTQSSKAKNTKENKVKGEIGQCCLQ